MTEIPDRLILHRARLAAKRSLNDLALATCIAPGMLRAMDNGQFDRLPAGLYARAYVRSVATALGLDPGATLAELLPLLPGLDSLAGTPPVVAAPAGPATRLANPTSLPIVAAASWSNGHDDEWRRFGGTLLDGLTLLALQLLIALLAGVAAGVGVGQLVLAAWPALMLLWLITSTLYFVVFAGVARSDSRRPLVRRAALVGGSADWAASRPASRRDLPGKIVDCHRPGAPLRCLARRSGGEELGLALQFLERVPIVVGREGQVWLE